MEVQAGGRGSLLAHRLLERVHRILRGFRGVHLPRAGALPRAPLRDRPLQPGQRKRDSHLAHPSLSRQRGARGELPFRGGEVAVHHVQVRSVHHEVELPRHPILPLVRVLLLRLPRQIQPARGGVEPRHSHVPAEEPVTTREAAEGLALELLVSVDVLQEHHARLEVLFGPVNVVRVL